MFKLLKTTVTFSLLIGATCSFSGLFADATLADQISDEEFSELQTTIPTESNTSKKIQKQSYFPDGKLKRIATWTYNEQGQGVQHGREAEFYPNGQLKHQGNIVKGQRSSTWVFVSENGMITKGTYIDGKKSGNWKVWSSDRQLLINENYFNNSLHGPRYTFYENSKQASEEFYTNSMKQGTFKTWYMNGYQSNSLTYQNDLQHGEIKSWDTSGALLVHGHFHMGTPDGSWKWYDLESNLIKSSTFKEGTGTLYEYTKARHRDEEGNVNVNISLKKEVPFKEGKINGLQKNYYPNSNVASKINFKEGQQYGPFEEKYQDGNIKLKGNYLRGKPQGTIYTYHTKKENDASKPVISKMVVYQSDQEHALLTEYSKEGVKTLEMELFNEVPNGSFRTFYADGTLMTTGQFSNGQRTGTWNENYSDGTLHLTQDYFLDNKHGKIEEWYNTAGSDQAQKKLEGRYYSGEKDSNWVEWYSNGSIASHKNYRNGLEEGEYLEYWPETPEQESSLEELRERKRLKHDSEALDKRRLKTKGFYIAGNREGEWKTWFPNSLLQSKVNFNKGKQDGLAQEWFNFLVDSQHVLKLEGKYANGFQEGQWQSFYRDGKTETEQFFSKGKLDGTITYYYETGEKKLITNFQQGIQEGSKIEYYPNGNKRTETFFSNDLKHGSYLSYHGNENKAIEGVFLRGIPVKTWSWYDQTEKTLLKSSDFNNGTGMMYEFYPTGEKKTESAYSSGLKHGEERLWYLNGSIQARAHYQEGQLHGEYEEYHEEGSLLAKTSWIYGKRNGGYRSWFGNKQQQFDLNFVDDRIHGKSEEWYENGKKRSEGRWITGTRHGKWIWFDRYGDKTLEQVYDSGIVLSSRKLDQAASNTENLEPAS
jgi:uncharacterized protein